MKKMISAYPLLPQLYDLGKIHSYELKDTEKSISVFKRGTKVKDSYLYVLLGNEYHYQNRYREGVESCKSAIKLTPNYGWAYFILGENYRGL